jgi:hypothetical protein
VRDPAKAESIAQRGVHPVMRKSWQSASYANEAEQCDVIVHTALDASSRRDTIDRTAVETFSRSRRRSRRVGRAAAFIYTSDVWILETRLRR